MAESSQLVPSPYAGVALMRIASCGFLVAIKSAALLRVGRKSLNLSIPFMVSVHDGLCVARCALSMVTNGHSCLCSVCPCRCGLVTGWTDRVWWSSRGRTMERARSSSQRAAVVDWGRYVSRHPNMVLVIVEVFDFYHLSIAPISLL